MQFGTTPAGELLQLLTLQNDELTIGITNYGARMLSFVYGDVDLLYGPKTPQELMDDTCYCGAICGRVANRIARGTFTLDGQEYTLAVNNGPNHLHGGIVGYNARVWSIDEATDTCLRLSLVSPDGEEGYPGTVHITATYRLEGRALTLELRATTDAPTLLNLTNHAYWNLTGSGIVDDHTLQVNATEYTPMIANIPTGDISPVAGTLYDLTTPAPLGERNAPGAIEGGYDDNYVLPAPGIMRDAAVLSNGWLTLRVATDAPGLQVYTGDYLPLPRGGVALEAQNYPDSPHQPHFPSIILRPGETYTRTIRWSLD